MSVYIPSQEDILRLRSELKTLSKEEISNRIGKFIKYGMEQDLQKFVHVWELDQSCPISNWCKSYVIEHPGSQIQDQIDDFVQIGMRFPAIMRLQHYHISFLLSPELGDIFIDVVKTCSVQAAIMYLKDQTITEEQAQVLYDVISDPRTGAPEYYSQFISGELTAPNRGALINLESEITQNLILSMGNTPTEEI